MRASSPAPQAAEKQLCNQNEETGHNGENKKERTRWSTKQTTVLVDEWKNNFEELETFKSPHIWNKIKLHVDAYGIHRFLVGMHYPQ